jgi:hypothetical protein
MPMERQGDALGNSNTHTSPHYPSVCVLCVVGRLLWRHSTGSRREAAEKEDPFAQIAKGEGDTAQATTPGDGPPKALPKSPSGDVDHPERTS